jgi:hypothetical protein
MSKEEFTGFTISMSQGPPMSGDLILGAGGFPIATISSLKLVLETFTEPSNTHYSGPKEKVFDEAFTEPGNKHSSGPKEKVFDETFTEPGNTHSSGSKMKDEDTTPLFEDDHVYEVIPIDDSKTNNQSSYQDSLQTTCIISDYHH